MAARTPTANGEQRWVRAARRVRRRLALSRWVATLGATAVPLFAVAVLGLLAVRALAATAPAIPLLATVSGSLTWGSLLIATWLIVATVFVAWRRPGVAAALAHWDERAGRQEMFVSAYSLARRPHSDSGVRLHLARAERELGSAMRDVRRDLPVFFRHRTWIAPAVFFIVAGAGFLLPDLRAGDDGIARDSEVETAAVAARLEEETKLADLEGLDPEEKQAAAELERRIAETAEKLKELSDATPREVLEELERRAREAEKLAEQLGDLGHDRIGSAMLAELERHADTHDLAEAIRGQDLEGAARESVQLADTLESPELTLEARARMEEAFRRALEVATPEDLRTQLGEHLAEANEKLEQDDPPGAATEFRELAEKYGELAQRLESRERLDELAKKLRGAAQEMLGRKDDGVEQLAENSLRRLSRRREELPQLPEGMFPQGEEPELASLNRETDPLSQLPESFEPWEEGPTGPPVPGTKPGEAGEPGSSGDGKCESCEGKGCAECGGSGRKPGGGSRVGAGRGPARVGQGSIPVPGSRPGGLKAGTGTAPLEGQPRERLPAEATEVVEARPVNDGATQVRQLSGQGHREDATVERRASALEFLRAEEEALAAEPLPLSRRAQVLRYFTILRRQLEGARD